MEKYNMVIDSFSGSGGMVIGVVILCMFSTFIILLISNKFRTWPTVNQICKIISAFRGKKK